MLGRLEVFKLCAVFRAAWHAGRLVPEFCNSGGEKYIVYDSGAVVAPYM